MIKQQYALKNRESDHSAEQYVRYDTIRFDKIQYVRIQYDKT